MGGGGGKIKSAPHNTFMCWGSKDSSIRRRRRRLVAKCLAFCVFHVLSFLYPLPTFNSLPTEPLGGTMEKHMCTHVFIPLQKTRGGEGIVGGGGVQSNYIYIMPISPPSFGGGGFLSKFPQAPRSPPPPAEQGGGYFIYNIKYFFYI